jgi:hypothetical protein
MENKDFIQYPEALELKQLGFNEPCFGYYHEDMSISYTGIFGQNTNSFWLPSPNKIFTAPTYSQAFRWFREKYDLHCYIEPYINNQFDYVLVSDLFGQEDCDGELLNTYEEAELACLREMIKIIKEKQK